MYILYLHFLSIFLSTSHLPFYPRLALSLPVPPALAHCNDRQRKHPGAGRGRRGRQVRRQVSVGLLAV